MAQMTVAELKDNAIYLRRKVIKTAWMGKAGHITSSLSMLDILNVLYFGDILRYDPNNEIWEDRDRFILSKAHGGLGLYVVLAKSGFFSEKELETYCHPGQHLGDHANFIINGVENSGGSLGHGLAIAAGKAIAGRMRGKDYLTYVLTGDGECQEGSIWEAAMTIGNFKLNNLVWIIDYNELQANGFVNDVNGLRPLKEKLDAFGFDVAEIDGHNYKELCTTLKIDRTALPEKPFAVIAHTIKGKGIPLFEGKEGWHGRTPSKEEYEIIIKQLGLSMEEFEGL